MLSDLAFPFDLIDLTETKIKSDHDPASNISIPDYEFISLPTLTNAGGVGFYIKRTSISISEMTRFVMKLNLFGLR